jgi:hypothetical protein
MRKVISLLLFLICVHLNAQPAISWGELQSNNNHAGSDYIGVSTESEQCIYLIKTDNIDREKENWYMEAISKQDKKIIFSKTLLTPNSPDKAPIKWSALTVIGKKLYLLSSHYAGDGTFNVYATSLNPLTGDAEEIKVIYTVINRSNDTPYFTYALSPDKSKLLICPVPFDPTYNSVKIVNEDLQSVWEGLLTIPVQDTPWYYYTPIMDNNNNMAFYRVEYENEMPAGSKLILYSPSSDKGKILHVDVPSAYIAYSEKLKIYENDKLYFAGLLLDKNNIAVTAGIITAFVDLERQEYMNAEFTIFDKEQIAELRGEGTFWEYFFPGPYFIKDVFFRPNGTIGLLAEQKYADRSYFMRGGPSRYMIGYSATFLQQGSNFVFAVNLSLRGYVNWLKIIPKYQTYEVKEYLSYVSAYDDKNVYLVFNDNFKNVDNIGKQSPKCMENPHEAVIVSVSIDDYGTVKKQKLYSADDDMYLPLKPLLCAKPKSNTLLLFTEKSNALRLGEVILK